MKTRTKTKRNSSMASRRGMAIFMSVCLLFTMSAVYGLAGDESESLEKMNSEASSAIVAFEELSNSVTTQTVENGTGLDDLNLPRSISGTASDGSSVEVSGITWESSPAYDGNTAGEYVFSGILPDDVDADVNLPSIVVVVEENMEELVVEPEEPKAEKEPLAGKDNKQPAAASNTTVSAFGEKITLFAGEKQIPLDITDFKVQRNGLDISLPGNTETFKDGDLFSISLDWAVDYGSMPAGDPYVHNGDYALFNLWTGAQFPLEYAPMTTKVYMKDPSNPLVDIEIGDLVLNANGNVRIDFNANLGSLTAVTGKMSLGTKVTYTPSTKPIEDIKFYEEDKSHTFVFEPNGTNPSSVRKTAGVRTGTGAALGNIKWTFDVNTILAPIKGSPVIKDTMTSSNTASSTGDRFKEDTLVVYEVSVDLTTGLATKIGSNLIKDTDYEVNFINNVMEITLLGTDPYYGRAYRVEYESIPATPTQGANSSYTNRVEFNGNISNAYYSWNTNMTHEKYGEYTEDPEGKVAPYIQWYVHVNQGNNRTPDIIEISDTFPSNPGYGAPTDFTLYLTAGDYIGWSTDVLSDPTLKARHVHTDPAATATGFTMKINGNLTNSGGTRYGYLITYKTPITDSTKMKFENSANIAGKNVPGEVDKEGYQGIPGVDKHFDKDGHSEDNKTLKWTSVVYPGYSTVSNFELRDRFTISTDPAGKEAGINMELTTIDSITLGTTTLTYDSTGALTGPNQYTFTKVAGATENGFNITFSSDVAIYQALLEIKYTTEYTLPPLNVTTGGYDFDDITFKNTMSLYISNNLKGQADAEYTLEASEWKNGAKSGTLNPANGVIDWEILLNSHMANLSDPIEITDIFPTDKKNPGDSVSVGLVEYVDGSILLQKRDLPTDPWATVAPGAFSITGGDKTKGFNLTISSPGPSEYRVTYKTKIIGIPSDEYENRAEIPFWEPLIASVPNTVTGMLSKEATLDTDNIIHWNIELNEANTVIEKDVKIVDTLSVGHEIIPSTIKLHNNSTNVDAVAGVDYELIIDTTSQAHNVLKINIKDTYDFNVHHTLTYDTVINVDTVEYDYGHTSMVVSNHAVLTGANNVYGEDDVEEKNMWSWIDASGQGTRIPIKIRKVSEENDTYGLPGAEFKIETLSGTQVSQNTFVTTGEGANGGYTDPIYLLVGEYIITEVTPPNGYALAKETTQSAIITINTADNYTFVFKNPRSKIACEVDKDTIRRTSAAYVSLPGQEGINNVGSEQYRYDVNFRGMANVPATDFVLKDPLENVKLGQVKVDMIWTPIVWGDRAGLGNTDGLFDVYYATASNPTVRPWPGYQNLSTQVRHELVPPANDLLTHVEFRYGDVEVGFTSSVDKRYSLNGEHRASDGTVKLPDGTKNTDKIEPLSDLQLKNYDYMRAAIAKMDSNTVKAFASGIGSDSGGDYVDWTPATTSSAVNFSQNLLAEYNAGSVNLKPATYLVSALKPMQSEDIVSSASSHIFLGGTFGSGGVEQDNDQDAVVTKEIVTFEATPDNIDIEGLVMEDSFIDNARAQGITVSGGNLYDSNGQLLTTAKTGDKALLGLWMSLMAGALVIILILTVIDQSRKRKLSSSKGGAK